MKYIDFFQLEIHHSYFPDKMESVTIVPDIDTKQLMKRHGLLIKKEPNGIRVLQPTSEEGIAIPVVDREDVFSFTMFPTTDLIQEITDTSGASEDKILFFTNEGVSSGDLLLSEASNTEKLDGFPAIAMVAIYGSELIAESDGSARIYRAVFNSKSVTWKYYFVCDPENADLSIETRKEQLSFTQLETDTDEIADSLRSNFPDTKISLFESNTSIPYSLTSIKDIKLTQDGEEIIKHLPNPTTSSRGIQILKIK